MGFLKRFFNNVLHETPPTPVARSNSFENLTAEELEAHLAVDTYGAFRLTAAVRPAYNLQIVPKQGYRHDAYQDDESQVEVPVLMASATREILFDLFLELLDPLGPVVDVVLETSHHHDGGGHLDLYREHIDLPVLKSTLWEYEDLLLNDGCTGIAVLNPATPQEIQFDEHKMLIVYGEPLAEFEHILQRNDVYPDPRLRFITEAEHVHSSSDDYYRVFEELTMRLGMETAVC
ncbi:MAG TPA: hypothetical protein ENJ50_01400 [Planctomycetaceae bacterium]|nr:hypothetical protein [Planctomycetaceae bacterium]